MRSVVAKRIYVQSKARKNTRIQIPQPHLRPGTAAHTRAARCTRPYASTNLDESTDDEALTRIQAAEQHALETPITNADVQNVAQADVPGNIEVIDFTNVQDQQITGTLMASRLLAPTNSMRELALQRLNDRRLIRSTTRISTPSPVCTRKPTKISRTESPHRDGQNKFRRQHRRRRRRRAATAAVTTREEGRGEEFAE
ncbi:hypothetical protein F511_36089 [Dorcoceras hygrometricum]|uniref:Uncharacterized protein n=1 Tax=Dorcoceras hygrometricum TaxID=472368 RepID=A0A2Z7B5U4_9LAMI|nr:hypothetical protein F511_36089 [Dorcoceras hygrometricum]